MLVFLIDILFTSPCRFFCLAWCPPIWRLRVRPVGTMHISLVRQGSVRTVQRFVWLCAHHLPVLANDQRRPRLRSHIDTELGGCPIQDRIQLGKTAVVQRRKQMVQMMVAELGDGQKMVGSDSGSIDDRVHLEDTPIQVGSVQCATALEFQTSVELMIAAAYHRLT